ncbi:formate/nitrite transporter family protein [Sphingomonas nostoxanthinifaciens]|uniref:formate/nitrite transporter family protein n=1 Tax=Sphingomonas nostoxanthinifaciens TaxID=2872652 RepID=UPI001CC20052|nr:formate/nitrite transporter family protein [Sphingomonas nostoxanthinifaciens]UAK25893.1 formate/nitrite transporter family protein [Sphingomonas nostoxanthinifaciens]
MTYTENVLHFAKLGETKAEALARAPGAFMVGALLGGAYIGIALILALTVSSGLPAGVRPLAAGAVFGLGLLLVLFAGAELFTGTVMYAVLGVGKGRLSLGRAIVLTVVVRVGNLVGAALLGWIFAAGGGGAVFGAPAPFLHDYVAHKISPTPFALVARASLCNWLVCLAIWAPARLKDDTAKIFAMAWCLLAFVACGFEHSVANMTLFTLALLDPTPLVDFASAGYNLLWVTIGNIIGGGLFVGGAYMLMARGDAPAAGDAARS